jgi:transcriptional regulator with XRE-family HTH domain
MFWQWLQGKLNERGWKPDELADKAGLGRSHVYKLLSPHYQQNPRRETVRRIAEALGVPLSEAMRAAGYEASAHFVYDTNDIFVETANLLREVPERYYSDAVHFLRRQLTTARELFVKEPPPPI